MEISPIELERFWKKAPVRPDNDCWNWIASKDKDGYGYFKGSGCVKAHRYSLQLKLGRPIGKGLKALHTCDNPSCVNPSHLYEGTQVQNEADKISRGRHRNQQKTHCPKGHEYNAENSYTRPDKPHWRNCRKCRTATSLSRKKIDS